MSIVGRFVRQISTEVDLGAKLLDRHVLGYFVNSKGVKPCQPLFYLVLNGAMRAREKPQIFSVIESNM